MEGSKIIDTSRVLDSANMSLPFLIKDRREFIREQSAMCLYNLRMTNWTLRNIQQNKCLVVNVSNPKSK